MLANVLAVVSVLAAEAEEKSKTPYFVTGFLLAGWAVAIAVVGIRQPEFARQRRQGQLVILVSGLLVVATVAAVVISS